MKSHRMKSGLWVAAVLCITLGCAKTHLREEDPQDEPMILSVSVTNQETKTMLSAPSDGVCEVLWKTGDRISVNGTLSDNAVTARENGTKDVDFTISASQSAPYKVLYPGTASVNVIRSEEHTSELQSLY